MGLKEVYHLTRRRSWGEMALMGKGRTLGKDNRALGR